MEHAKGSDAEIRGNVLKSGLLNGVSLISIWVFEFLVGLASRRHGNQSVSASERGFIHRNLGWFYQALWLVPTVGASLYLNVSWDFLSHGHHIDTYDFIPSPRGVMSLLGARLSFSTETARLSNNNQLDTPDCSTHSRPAHTGW